MWKQNHTNLLTKSGWVVGIPRIYEELGSSDGNTPINSDINAPRSFCCININAFGPASKVYAT